MLLDIGQVQEFPGGQAAQLVSRVVLEELQIDTVQVELLDSPLGPAICVLLCPLGWVLGKGGRKGGVNWKDKAHTGGVRTGRQGSTHTHRYWISHCPSILPQLEGNY